MKGIGGVFMNHCRRIGTFSFMYLMPVLLMLTVSCKFLPFGLGDSTPKPNTQNEPSGFKEQANRGFDNLTENDWIYGGDASAYAELNDDAAPESKPHIGRVTMLAGMQSGASPIHFERNFDPSDAVYVNTFFRVSDNFQRNPIADALIAFWAGDEPRLFWGWRGDESDGTMHPAALVSSPSLPGGSLWLDANLVPDAKISRGAWHNVEVLIDSKGTYAMWLDGVKIASYDNVPYGVLEEGRHWDIAMVGPAWGGLTPPLDQTQTVDFDHFYMSAKKN